MDAELRDLERRAAADPADEAARLALGLALVRAGKTAEALAWLGATTRAGYAAVAREPELAGLLDAAPEWRSSGGDARCTRRSAAEPIAAPATAWRRRLAGPPAGLGL